MSQNLAPPGVDTGPPDGLTIAVSQPHTTVVLVRAIGELDLLSAPRCARILAAAIRTVAPAGTGRGRVVCDLDGVEFLAASGMGMLVETADRARELGVDLVLVAGGTRVMRPLTLTGLDRVLDLASHLDDAVGRPAAA